MSQRIRGSLNYIIIFGRGRFLRLAVTSSLFIVHWRSLMAQSSYSINTHIRLTWLSKLQWDDVSFTILISVYGKSSPGSHLRSPMADFSDFLKIKPTLLSSSINNPYLQTPAWFSWLFHTSGISFTQRTLIKKSELLPSDFTGIAYFCNITFLPRRRASYFFPSSYQPLRWGHERST